MKIRYLIATALLIGVLVVSGCAGPRERASDSPSTGAVITPPTAEIMDSEITVIEADMAELDLMLTDLDSIQDMSFTELDGINF